MAFIVTLFTRGLPYHLSIKTSFVEFSQVILVTIITRLSLKIMLHSETQSPPLAMDKIED
jgi:hypothetical protein